MAIKEVKCPSTKRATISIIVKALTSLMQSDGAGDEEDPYVLRLIQMCGKKDMALKAVEYDIATRKRKRKMPKWSVYKAVNNVFAKEDVMELMKTLKWNNDISFPIGNKGVDEEDDDDENDNDTNE